MSSFFENLFGEGPQRVPIDPDSPAGQALAEQYHHHNAMVIENTHEQHELAMSVVEAQAARINQQTSLMRALEQALPWLVVALVWRAIVGGKR